MISRNSFSVLVCACVILLSTVTVVRPALAQTNSTINANSRGAVVQMDRAMLQQHLRALGYKTRGGVGKDKSDSNDPHFRSLPHFTSSFSVGGVTYPYTMLGFQPRSGQTAQLRSVIIPLRMRFFGFGKKHNVNVDFDAKDAVTNIAHSPLYQEARFANADSKDSIPRFTGFTCS